MARKRAENAAPARRSRRLQSQEPEDVIPLPPVRRKVKASSIIERVEEGEQPWPSLLTDRQKELLAESQISKSPFTYTRVPVSREEMEAKLKSSSLRRDLGWKDLTRRYGEKQQAEEVAAAKAVSPPPPPSPLQPPATVAAASPPVAPSGTTIQPASAPAKSWFTSVASYLTNPFSRKRPAVEDASPEDSTPSHKRVRITEPQEAVAPTEIETQKAIAPVEENTPKAIAPVETHSLKRPAAEELISESPTPSYKRARITAPHHAIAPVEIEPLKAIAPVQIKSTPRAQAPPYRNSLHPPSAHRPNEPTSLSTITEYTERSLLSDAPETTPSRPSKVTPRHMPVQQTPATPYTIRRAAAIREAKQQAQRSNMTHTQQTPWSFEKLASTPAKPKLPNADARLAKIERFRALQKELDELKQDKDIIDIESHVARNRKRVKIDRLVEIPHNRPGESSGTFRVPEYDSDDEMEVDIDAEELSNVFEEADNNNNHVFDWPYIPQQPADYEVTEEYREACGALFAERFDAWVAGGMV